MRPAISHINHSKIIETDGIDLANRKAISVKLFCEITGIGKTSFYKEVKAGRIKIKKRGSSTLILVEECESFLSRLSEA